MYGIDDGQQLLRIAQSVSMGADFYTPAVLVGPFDMGSVQCVWAGASPSLLLPGKIHVEVSVVLPHYCEVFPDAYTKKITVADGCALYSLENVTQKYLRVFFESRSNSGGLMDVYVFLKRRRGNNP